ncbi:caspase domain-containing protein [Gymnopilus junonius]|uniref:Caspase domain-containing protein n=1 Tax=Gymnopilus junonius TaxID=109634 RepID=A0A9P5N965_GYMJU|nr:caspase domain-containing protein [Gymnopilus junonius]
MASRPAHPWYTARSYHENSPILRQLAHTQWRDDVRAGSHDDRIRHGQSTKPDTPRLAFSPKPHLFALIIAINNYKEGYFRPLRGAEADALSFKDYLETYLQVPREQITVVLGKDATRYNIIRAFKKLETNSRIQPGNPVVIFYAGHGGEARAHESWEAGGSENKIQMLIPYDCSKTPGRQVPPIPDRTIGALIDRIAKAKGDNISVFFDCCNSASGTRSSGDSDIRVRSVELDDMAYYNPRVDEDILYDRTRGSRPATQYEHGGLKSHVFIAACGSSELAIESNGHGNFSRSLLKLLKTVPPERLRYCDILDKMDPILNQNPHCEGYNKQRFLFDTKVKPDIPEQFQVQFEWLDPDTDVPPQLVLKAGSAQGIVNGSRFKELRKGASLTVASVMPFKSILHFEPGFRLDQPSVAELIYVGPREDLRLYVHPHDRFRTFLKKIHDIPEYRFGYSLDNVVMVDNPAHAHLSARVSSNGHEVVFDMMDERATRYGFRRTFSRVKTDAESVAWEYEYDESGEFVLYPVGGNLCEKGIIDFVVDEKAPYGFKLINTGPHDFYASAFFFDFSDLSITQHLQGPVATNHYKPDYCLPKRRGSLTIGYGSGGVSPMAFDLHGRNMDFGFLKVIFSSQAIDLSHLAQRSPFVYTRGTKQWERPNEIWDSLLVPIIQRRHPAS